MGFGSRVSSSPSPPFSFLGSSVLDSGPVIQSKVGPSLGSLGSGFWLLRMMLQDDNLLDFLGSVALSDKEMVVEAKELEPSKAMESTCVSVGEELSSDSLPCKFANFNSFVGMLVASFEKEISSLLRKMKAGKGCGVKVSRGKGKPFSSSYFERET